MSARLDQAVYALLTPARGVIDRHGDNGAHRCRSCGLPWPCFDLGTAIGALDLVLRVHVAARNRPDDPTPAEITWGPIAQLIIAASEPDHVPPAQPTRPT